ncbi:hypothetical protein T459_08042 [Capsicum annuum]|uniref:Uncharacterized protein n=1 Tax=Capsicum annuum TaxID=4072 RepID=A0A2G2ZVG1_CAPAN|nr:hypothetical protein T459_08042 [Capsicum annuum]
MASKHVKSGGNRHKKSKKRSDNPPIGASPPPDTINYPPPKSTVSLPNAFFKIPPPGQLHVYPSHERLAGSTVHFMPTLNVGSSSGFHINQPSSSSSLPAASPASTLSSSNLSISGLRIGVSGTQISTSFDSDVKKLKGGADVTPAEAFAETHKKKKEDGTREEWIEMRAKDTYRWRVVLSKVESTNFELYVLRVGLHHCRPVLIRTKCGRNGRDAKGDSRAKDRCKTSDDRVARFEKLIMKYMPQACDDEDDTESDED